MKFQTLFKKASTGVLQEWTISTEGNVIVTRWGQENGAIQETRDVVKAGKNIGKKNETTAVQQAESEAQSRWEKKLKKNYVKSRRDAEDGKVDALVQGGVDVMLAHRFDEQGHKIVYPAAVQPKFDGHRCIAVVSAGDVTLWTRTRKPITGLPHINYAIQKWAARAQYDDIVLDGELYHHDYRDRFEELSSFIRTPEPKEGHEVVQYHVYDIAETDLEYKDRLELLADHDLGRPLVFVETLWAQDEEDLMAHFETFLAQGYEGAMVRNSRGLYANKRSYDLQKIKEFQDSEFPVVGVEEGRGKLAGHAIFVCKTADGTEFRVKMKGETEALQVYWKNPSKAIGKQLTVKYQGLTNKSGVPRFPVGLRFKLDD